MGREADDAASPPPPADAVSPGMEVPSGRGTAAKARLLPVLGLRGGQGLGMRAKPAASERGVTGERAWEGKHIYKCMCMIIIETSLSPPLSLSPVSNGGWL